MSIFLWKMSKLIAYNALNKAKMSPQIKQFPIWAIHITE